MATDDDVTETPTTDDSTRAIRTSQPRLGTSDTRYTFRDEIGRGGMGDVLAAHDTQLGREVAIKRPRSSAPSERQVARFVREARIQGRLDHPAVVPVHELGHDARGLPYFAMKRLAGTTLSATLRAPQPPRARLLRAFADVCLAVEFAHERGVIHRDLKPENIVLGDYGEAYVLDWGVAKVAGEDDEFDDLRADGLETQTGVAVGTPAYMAPEQALDSSAVDARADVFALGRILAEILAAEPVPPPELVAVATAALAEDRAARTPSARALGEQVQGYLDGDRDLALRRKLARDHLEHAQAAFGGELDAEARAVAIRAASSAMALNPTLEGAAELVGRLMLEPPRETPPEVERAILADDVAWAYAQTRGALRSVMLGFVSTVPLLLLFGALRSALVYGTYSLATIVIILRNLRSKPFHPTHVAVVAAVNAVAIALLAHAFGPFVVATVGAVLVAGPLGASPFIRTWRGAAWIGVALTAGVVLPALAEELGILARTTEVSSAGMLIHGVITPAPWMLVPLTTFLASTTIGAAIMISRFGLAQARDAQRRVHLQAWQLRQLVSDPLRSAG